MKKSILFVVLLILSTKLMAQNYNCAIGSSNYSNSLSLSKSMAISDALTKIIRNNCSITIGEKTISSGYINYRVKKIKIEDNKVYVKICIESDIVCNE